MLGFSYLRNMDWWERLWFSCALTFVIGLFGLIFKFTTADGSVDYCYVQMYNPAPEVTTTYRLYGHRNWRELDRHIASFATFDEAVKTADVLKCNIK